MKTFKSLAFEKLNNLKILPKNRIKLISKKSVDKNLGKSCTNELAYRPNKFFRAEIVCRVN